MRCVVIAITVLLMTQQEISLLGQGENPPKAVEPESINNNAPPPQEESRVRFVGNTKFSDKELSSALADPLAAIQQRGLSLPLADDTAYYLGVFYRRHGYAAVDVKYKIRGPYLELDISEGPYYKLGEIYFEGNKTFKPATLKDYMIGTTRARFSQFETQLPFVEADLVTGTTLLQSFYVSQGFPQVQIVKLATIPDNKNGVVNAIVTINEGPRFYFGPISFSANFGIAPTEFSAKIKSLTKPPKPYSDAELQNLQRDLTFSFKKKGYYSASVSVTPNFRGAHAGRVPVTVDAVPGPVYRFGAFVEHQGPNARVRPEFLPRRFERLRGETYDPDKLKDLYSKVYVTGLYDSLDIQEVPQPNDTIELVVNPQEAKAKELGFYGGYDLSLIHI